MRRWRYHEVTGQAEALELHEGPPRGGPSYVLGPEGRIRTGIPPLDRRVLYPLSYLGAVLPSVPRDPLGDKMAPIVRAILGMSSEVRALTCPSVPQCPLNTPSDVGTCESLR
jgi:hypothetical protein